MIELHGLLLNRASYWLGLLFSRQDVRPFLLSARAITCVRQDKRFYFGEPMVLVECAGARYLVIENYATVAGMLTSGRVAL